MQTSFMRLRTHRFSFIKNRHPRRRCSSCPSWHRRRTRRQFHQHSRRQQGRRHSDRSNAPSRRRLRPRLAAELASAHVRPGNEAQQSTQPQTGVDQERQQTMPNTQGPRPPQPQIQPPSQQTAPGQTPQTSTPAGTTAPQQQGATPGGAPATGAQQQTPGQQVGASSELLRHATADPPPVRQTFLKRRRRPLPSRPSDRRGYFQIKCPSR